MSATWYCQRCDKDHLGNCPETGTAESWNDRQLLDALAEYHECGNLRPLLDLGFLSLRDAAMGLRIVSARIKVLESERGAGHRLGDDEGDGTMKCAQCLEVGRNV